jgi:hypothetical protein
MKSRLTLLLLAAYAGSALAQYKCTGADGRITFQQTPCFGAKSEQKLTVIPNGHPPSASGVAAAPVASAASGAQAETNVDKKILARYEVQRQRDALEQALRSAQDDKARRATQKADAISGARRQFGDDPSNAQALREAVSSISSRYDAMAELDEERVRSAQAALDAWDKARN